MSDAAKVAEYEELKKQLQDAILRKKNLDKELSQLEEEIFHKEGAYLQDNTNGTIVRGFDSLNKLVASSNSSSSSSSSSAANKKGKQQYSEEDRVFSLSSNTFVRHLQKSTDGEEDSTEALSLSTEGTPNSSIGSVRKRRRDD